MTEKSLQTKAFFPQPYDTQAGELIFVPRCSISTDYMIREYLARFTAKDKRVQVAFYGDPKLATASLMIRGWADELIRLTSIIIEKDISWVHSHLKMADCLYLVASVLFDGVDPRKIKKEKEEPNRVKAKREQAEFAEWVHYFAERYGWTIDEIVSMSRDQFNAMIEAAQSVTEKQEQQRKKYVSPATGREMKPVSDRRTKDDPHGVASVEAFAKKFGVEG